MKELDELKKWPDDLRNDLRVILWDLDRDQAVDPDRLRGRLLVLLAKVEALQGLVGRVIAEFLPGVEEFERPANGRSEIEKLSGRMSEMLHGEEVIDFESLMIRVEGDRDLILEMVQLCLESLPGHVREVLAAVSSRDPEEIARAAHAVKGSVGALSAKSAFEAAHHLEKISRTGDLTAIGSALTAMEREIRRLEPALRGILAKLRPNEE